jgi:hypothetical protein
VPTPIKRRGEVRADGKEEAAFHRRVGSRDERWTAGLGAPADRHHGNCELDTGLVSGTT